METKRRIIMTTELLNELKEQAYKNACEKGFHEVDYSDQHYLMLIITELSEAVEAWRKNKRADITSYNIAKNLHKTNFSKGAFETFIKDSVEDELADTVIRTLDLAGLRGAQLIHLRSSGFDKELEDVSFDDTSFIEAVFKIIISLGDFEELCEDDFEYFLSLLITIIERLAEKYDIDLWWHVRQKMWYNESREYLHGKIC